MIESDFLLNLINKVYVENTCLSWKEIQFTVLKLSEAIDLENLGMENSNRLIVKTLTLMCQYAHANLNYPTLSVSDAFEKFLEEKKET